MRPNHILTILAVRDLGRSAAFYRDAFGFETRVEVPVYVELVLTGGRGLGLYDQEGFARNTEHPPTLPPSEAISGTEIYFVVSDLDRACARLEKAGAKVLSEAAPRDWGDRAAYFADPDGNVLVVAEPIGSKKSAVIKPATTEIISNVWSERWGTPIISLTRSYQPEDVEGLVLCEGETTVALVTWARQESTAEIVTLDALVTGQGFGGRVFAAAEEELRSDVERIFLITTNDNPRALSFYLRRHYRLVRLHLDEMDRVREQKSVPQVGQHGLPLRDVLELEKTL